jgi:hypothetical protein
MHHLAEVSMVCRMHVNCNVAEAANIVKYLAALCIESLSRLQVLVPLHCRYFTRDEGPPGTSIFVRNLPESITAEKLAEIFAKFGALRGAQPVSLKKQKDKDIFAFVDFQEPSAQQAAIASPPTLDGQQVCFEDVPDPTSTIAHNVLALLLQSTDFLAYSLALQCLQYISVPGMLLCG